jgi:hypothetical protein
MVKETPLNISKACFLCRRRKMQDFRLLFVRNFLEGEDNCALSLP